MQAIILAGGTGSRLGRIAKHTPKPFLEVDGNPFILKIVERLIKQKVTKIIFCLCYKPKKIMEFFGDGTNLGINISYIVEEKPMGTAGAIRAAYKQISSSNAIVLNGDSFCYFNIPKILKNHCSNNADATLSILKITTPERYGLVTFNKKMKIIKFIEKTKNYKNNINYINAGVYIIKKELIKKIEKIKPTSLERDFFPKILDKNIRAFILKENKFIDIGTPESLRDAKFFFKDK